MDAKASAVRLLRAPVVARPLRQVNQSRHLSDAVRWRLFLKVSKKVDLPAGTTFTTRLPGIAPVTLGIDGHARELYWTGSYEAGTLPIFVRYAATAAVVLDVGAADGLFSLFAAAANPAGAVVAFEPGLFQLQRLRQNIAANPAALGGRIQIVEAALSDTDGTAVFHEAGGNSSLNAGFRPGAVERPVDVARGDTVVADLFGTAPIGLIKIDTESTEPDVLRGLTATIARDRPVIVCEVLAGRTEDQLQGLVDAWGYRSWWLGPDGPVRRSAITGDPGHRHVNWLCLPDDQPPPNS